MSISIGIGMAAILYVRMYVYMDGWMDGSVLFLFFIHLLE